MNRRTHPRTPPPRRGTQRNTTLIATISNTPRLAAWGSTTAIAQLLGTEPSGGPEAELWFGAHPASPARMVDDLSPQGHVTLDEWFADSRETDGDSTATWLPFLLKVLAAAKPLSLQAHPTAAQAREGYDRENAAGVPLDAPQRNYPDPHPKPELVVALSERFDALVGFRPISESKAIFEELGEPEAAARLDDLPVFVAWLLSRGAGVDELVERVSRHDFTDPETLRLVRNLADDYPGDPGIVLALTLNRVTLRPGDALYVPAGTIHAYLEGLGIELMTASDNVLRGGLTVKHVDVPELLTVL
ncbi:MAG TPA: mannose-6-phosphate isomerase, class I, partial [Terrimesophilobacter sp.]|nr:mannose-6-phosphate isomerase, class I [Terrimesophilobacter sp.]